MVFIMNLISVLLDATSGINVFISKFRADYRTLIFSITRMALIIIALYFYFEKFLSLTINNIIQLTDGFSSLNNPEDYSLNQMTLSLGGLILLSFILARNEYKYIFNYLFIYPFSVIGVIKRPIELPKWREYITTIFAIIMFLIGFNMLPGLGFYIPEQIPLFFIGSGIVSAFILYQGGIPELLNTPFSIYRSRRDRDEIIRIIIQNLVYAMPILVFVYLCLNLAAWPVIESNLTQFFSFLITAIIVLWWIQYSREVSNPEGQERQISSMGLLLLLPFFMYLLTQIMFLLHHPNQGTMERWNLDFDFMYEKNPFEINTWPIDVNDNVDSRWRFWGAAILNSARVTLLSIFLCTILGVIIGVTRLSSNKLASSLATVYVEVFRNLPLAVLLFLISSQMGQSLPLFIEEANIRGMIYYSNQGIFIPGIDFMRLIYAIIFLLLVKLYLSIGDRNGVDDSERGLRRRFKIWTLGFAVSIGLIFSGEITLPQYIKPNAGIPGTWKIDEDSGFEITVEFLAMIIGLTLFTASVVAEIVRGSIQSLPRGQVEASISLGLNPYQRLRLVVLPQALRSMIPLLNSQYMNVWKNSSLAMIVAYSDIYYVINVMMNNVRKLIPLFLILLLTYQFGSLIISAVMNLYNSRVTKVKI